MKKTLLKLLSVALCIVLLIATLAACNGGGISQEEADRLQRDIDRLQDELDRARADNINAGNGGNGGNGNSDRGSETTPITPDLPAIDETPVSDFEYRAIVGGIEITGYTGTSIRVRIPETIEGLPVISISALGPSIGPLESSSQYRDISAGGFDNTGVGEVYIPNSVTNIGTYAFSRNPGLTNIVLPDGLSVIGSAAFYRTGLTSITIPNGVTEIGSYAFYESLLTSITIPDSVDIIKHGAFLHIPSLSSVTIPDNVPQMIGAIYGGPPPFDSDYLTSITHRGITFSKEDQWNLNEWRRFLEDSLPEDLLVAFFR